MIIKKIERVDKLFLFSFFSLLSTISLFSFPFLLSSCPFILLVFLMSSSVHSLIST